MKRFLKIIGIFIFLFFVIIFAFYLFTNKKLPKGIKGKPADELAIKMLNTLEHKAFENTEIIEWTFRGNHHYKWLKQENIVHVNWGSNKVILNTKKPKKSIAFIDDIKVENQKLIEKARDYFHNDSFWIVAPYKLFDKGTERRIVTQNGKELLLVTYTSGGSTPGDSYLWEIDENGYPINFKMWVSIIPIGGIEVKLNSLLKTESGMYLSNNQKFSLFNLKIPIKNVRAYNPKADSIAKKIIKNILHENYKKTNFLEWSFNGKRNYIWNKKVDTVAVFWDNIQVNLFTKNIKESKVFVNKKRQKTATSKLIQKAQLMFNNDSFWLVAPHKLFDKGTYRYLKEENTIEKLFVKYTYGGSTPGDTYAWFLNKNYIPNRYEMYIPSMKINGKKASWENWITTKSGTLLPKIHTFENGSILNMGEVKGYN